MIPYPPSFSKMAASTIDPAIGASTWALGNHKCVENRGNFTRNPRIKIRAINMGHRVLNKSWLLINILEFFVLEYRYKNMVNIGTEAIMVYIIMYILA